MVSAFPSLGLYHAAPAGDVREEPECLIGDAVDDLVDILLDLREVLWFADRKEIENAYGQFLLSFRSHWGQHLRALQSYLHSQQ